MFSWFLFPVRLILIFEFVFLIFFLSFSFHFSFSLSSVLYFPFLVFSCLPFHPFSLLSSHYEINLFNSFSLPFLTNSKLTCDWGKAGCCDHNSSLIGADIPRLTLLNNNNNKKKIHLYNLQPYGHSSVGSFLSVFMSVYAFCDSQS